MSSPIVARLFAAVGLDAPAPGSSLGRAFVRCPQNRLVRVVAWYAWECGRGFPSEGDLALGMRMLIRGWDDAYPTLVLPSGVPHVNVEEPGEAGTALVTRRERIGRGWLKESVSIRGEVRPEVELGTLWLSSRVGCIVHDDCAANPDLGIACLAHRS